MDTIFKDLEVPGWLSWWCVALDLGVVSSSPIVGTELTLKNKNKKIREVRSLLWDDGKG